MPPGLGQTTPSAKTNVLTQAMLPGHPSGTVYINYYDNINAGKVRALMAVVTEVLVKMKPATLYFCLSSPGGDVGAGITLYNFLRGLSTEIVMHNMGSVDSIATVIFLAANKRFACQYSRFLFHGIKLNFPQGFAATTPHMRELLSGMDQDESRIREIVVERSNLTAGEMSTLFQQGEAKNPAFALEKGIISDIRDLIIPEGAKVITANFN